MLVRWAKRHPVLYLTLGFGVAVLAGLVTDYLLSKLIGARPRPFSVFPGLIAGCFAGYYASGKYRARR